MQMIRRIGLSLLVSAALAGAVVTAEAADRTIFAGCVTERTDTTITLDTSGGELITIDTTWLKPTMADALTADCLTVTAMTVEGRYVAESVEVGDEPNEVRGIANGLTTDRENRDDAEDKRRNEDDD